MITKLLLVQHPVELVPHGENCPQSLGTNCWSSLCFYTEGKSSGGGKQIIFLSPHPFLFFFPCPFLMQIVDESDETVGHLSGSLNPILGWPNNKDSQLMERT